MEEQEEVGEDRIQYKHFVPRKESAQKSKDVLARVCFVECNAGLHHASSQKGTDLNSQIQVPPIRSQRHH